MLLNKPSGETRKVSRVMVLNNLRVPEGSLIEVVLKPAKPIREKLQGPTVGEVAKDFFAMTARL